MKYASSEPAESSSRLKHGMQDPGTHVTPERIDAFIERVFNDAPRVATLAKSEAA